MAQPVTAEKLVQVSIRLFGDHGLDGVTTRAIAQAAGAQQSAIGYHFGTKERLYIACAEDVAARIHTRMAPLMARSTTTSDPAEARAQIEAILGGLVAMMTADDIAPRARFVVREQMNPTPAFDVLWDRAIRHLVEPILALMRVVAGRDVAPEHLRIRCFTLMGQVFAFRFGRATLVRITGWERMADPEFQLAKAAVLANVRAILADVERGGGS